DTGNIQPIAGPGAVAGGPGEGPVRSGPSTYIRRMRPHLLALALFVAQLARAGGDGHPLGARLAGMGYAGSALADLWALRLNPAGLAALDTAQVGAVYQRHFFADELAQQGLAVAIPLGNGTLGIAADRFGYSLYN